VSTNSQSQIFTDQGSSDRTVPELLKELGFRYKFLLFKNAVGELQLSYHSHKLRFRLKKNNGEIHYTSHVSSVDRILEQVAGFLSGGETLQEHFVFFAARKDMLFDFEETEKAAKLAREEAERVAQRELEETEMAIKKRQKFLAVSRVFGGAIAVILIVGFAYVKTFSYVALSHDLLKSEPNVRVIYAPEQIKEAFQISPIIGPMREARAQGLDLSNKLFSLEQEITQLVKLKTAERSRLSNLSDKLLITEFPSETKPLTEVPADIQPVIRGRKTAPGLNTRDLANALGISYSKALSLKWDLDSPAKTVVSPGVFRTEQRAMAKSAAIEAIMSRFEDELPLKIQSDVLQAQLTRNQEAKTTLQQQALEKIKNLGFVKPTSSWFQVRRKPCLLVFEQHGWIFDLAGNQFKVELALTSQGQHSFLDYVLQLYSPADLAPSALNK